MSGHKDPADRVLEKYAELRLTTSPLCLPMFSSIALN